MADEWDDLLANLPDIIEPGQGCRALVESGSRETRPRPPPRRIGGLVGWWRYLVDQFWHSIYGCPEPGVVRIVNYAGRDTGWLKCTECGDVWRHKHVASWDITEDGRPGAEIE